MPIEDGQKSKLSLHSSGFDKATDKINILIKKCKNLNTQKAEGLTIYAKIDFNEIQIAESQKIQITPETVPDLNFSSVLSVNANDSNNLDEIAYKPVIVTLIEVLPKEKKQKEEKIQIFGQSTFDVLCFLKGETEVSLKLTVYPVPGSTLELQPSDAPLPELEVKLSIDQPILSDDEQAKSNLLTITLDGMYALPESWNNNTKEYAYTVSLPVPLTEEKDNPIVFVNGIQKSPSDTGPKQKRWADTRGIQATNALFMPNSFITDDPNVEELGDFQMKEDKEYRINSEREKPRIIWNSERRVYLSHASYVAFREQVLKTRYLPIEIIRSSIPTGVKGKRDEDLSMSYHGIVYIDMQPLLYPGATQIKGAYKIHPFNDADFTNKTKRKNGIVDETLKIVSSLYDRNYAISPLKKDQKAVEKKDPKKARESMVDGHDISQSVQQILDSRSFIVIDLKFDKPLIPRKPLDYLVKRVAELIPSRPKYSIRTNSAEKAVNDYHSQIKSIVDLVLDEYRNISTDSDYSGLNSDITRRENEFEMKRKRLLYELNSSGKYFAFKEQLKNSVIKIVREKFCKTSALNDPDEFQQFLSELYVFLIDELHKALNNIISIEDIPVIEETLTDNEQMKHFALEAEMNRNYDLAAFYYQERIAREKDNYKNWLDYAIFNLLIEDYARSEECLKECIAINQNDTNGLLLYSVICCMQEKTDVAETFLDRVTAQDSDNVIAWTLYALLYENKGLDLNADITLKRVIKLNQSQLADLQASLAPPPPVETMGEEEAAAPAPAPSTNQAAKKEDPLEISEESKNEAQSKSRNSKRGVITNTAKNKMESSSKSPKSPGINSKIEEHGLSLKEKQLNTELSINKSIYTRTANFLIKYNAFAWAEKCMAKELLQSGGGPSCQYHILLAKIKLAKNQLDDAERHSNEALQFDYQNYEGWIIWAHTRYLSGDFQGAKERYERILQFSELPADQTHSIYIRLASIYLKEENYETSKKLFLYPCKNSPSCMSWLGVGICSYRLDQLEEAKSALCEANILNNKAPEVWAYLSLICLRTNKPLEAEQAYKYAIKLNLDNPELLEEIKDLQEKVGFGNPEF